MVFMVYAVALVIETFNVTKGSDEANRLA